MSELPNVWEIRFGIKVAAAKFIALKMTLFQSKLANICMGIILDGAPVIYIGSAFKADLIGSWRYAINFRLSSPRYSAIMLSVEMGH